MERAAHNSIWTWLRLAAATAALFLAAKLISGWFGSQPGSIAALWPGKALMLGLLLVAGRTPATIAAILCGGIIGSLAYLVGLGSGFVQVAVGTAEISATGLLAFLVLRAGRHDHDLFERTSGVVALVVAAAIASLLPAAIGAVFAVPGRAAGAALAYAGSLLSMLVITPAVVIAGRLSAPETLRFVKDGGIGAALGTLVAVLCVSLLVFAQGALPLLFAVGPVVLLAAFRLRSFGAVAAVGIVAAVAVRATMAGLGPIAAAPGGVAAHVLVLHLFLACCFLGALPVAAMLAEHDRCTAESRALAERFRAVVETVSEVIFQIDPGGTWTYLNPAWARLTGRTIEECLGRPWMEAVSASDRPQLALGMAALFAGEIDTLTQSVRLDVGETSLWAEMVVHASLDRNGRPVGATGTLRDVDAAKRREELASIAHHHAEERAREAARLASTDELTGLPNRRAFMRQLDREIAASAEFGWPLSVAMFDLDHFKAVNDSHGHATGDRVLRLVAERAGTVVRSGDLVGRLGGEEFAILMPGATADDAALVAERLRQAVQAAALPDCDLPEVTISIGLAERVERRTADRLLAVADAALYRAKQEGRNQVCVAA